MVKYEPIGPNSGALPIGTTPETEVQPDGSLRQVVAIKNSGDGVPFQTEIIDADGHIVNVQAVTNEISGDEYGAVVISLIHGKDAQGDWHDVKVTAAGALTTEATIAGQDVPLDVHQVDDNGNSIIITGAVTGEKGVRVFAGPTDPISDIPVNIEFAHHQRHEGETHRFQYDAGTIGTGTVKFALVVPNTYTLSIRAPHALIGANVYNGAVRLDVYEGATYTGGAAMTAYNVNRNSANTPQMTGFSAVTSTNGTLLPFSSFIGSGGKAVGERTTDEIELKVNTTYRIDLKGLAAGTQAILLVEFYEDLGV